MAPAAQPYASGSSLGTPCSAVPCSAGVPLEWLAEAQPLLSLKAAAEAANSSAAAAALSSWDPIVPPCTSDPNATTCYTCGQRDGACGTIRMSDGALLCNWRGVACRGRRVVGLALSRLGLQLSTLPAGLANGTQLEQLDLAVSRRPGRRAAACR